MFLGVNNDKLNDIELLKSIVILIPNILFTKRMTLENQVFEKMAGTIEKIGVAGHTHMTHPDPHNLVFW